MKKYEIVEGKDIRSITEESRNLCEYYHDERTYDVHITNQTRAKFEIVFFQVLDQSGNIPNGFVSDTGVYVGARETNYGESVYTDPCEAGGMQKLIQGTRFKASWKWVEQDGRSGTAYPNDIVVPEPNTYYATAGWRFHYSRDTGEPTAVVDLQMVKKA